MTSRSTSTTLRTPAQLESLASPERLAIIRVLHERGPLTAAELAQCLGRSAQSIHYHLGALGRVRLVRKAGMRSTLRRPAVIYELTSDTVKADPEEDTPAFRRARRRVYESVLRLAQREVVGGMESDDPAARSRSRVHRLHATLTRRHCRELEALLTKIEKLFRECDGAERGRSITLTIALADVDETGKP